MGTACNTLTVATAISWLRCWRRFRPRLCHVNTWRRDGRAAMKYRDGEKCKGSVPAWPVDLISHTSGLLRQIKGVQLDV
jgi:hypothetical protein